MARRGLAPDVPKRDREADPDPGLFAKLASVGIPGVVAPRRYGGAGLRSLPVFHHGLRSCRMSIVSCETPRGTVAVASPIVYSRFRTRCYFF